MDFSALIPSFVENHLFKAKWKSEYKEWLKKGKPVPLAHLEKQRLIRDYAMQYGTNSLVETGTYKGEMLLANLNNFSKLYSIELSPVLAIRARKKFRKHPHITIIEGDSGAKMRDLVKELEDKTLFWLDGHYSAGITAKGQKECPILEELAAIFQYNRKGDVILIDDARCFTGQNDYPTREELKVYIEKHSSDYSFKLEGDVFVLEPK